MPESLLDPPTGTAMPKLAASEAKPRTRLAAIKDAAIRFVAGLCGGGALAFIGGMFTNMHLYDAVNFAAIMGLIVGSIGFIFGPRALKVTLQLLLCP